MKTTGENTQNYSEYFKQQAVISAQNLFTSVTDALERNPGIKQTIIMKQIPRYDTRVQDPTSVKSALSQLYNNTRPVYSVPTSNRFSKFSQENY